MHIVHFMLDCAAQIMHNVHMQEICETDYFAKKADKLLSQEEYETLIATLSLNPEAGEVIKHTNGLRKMRLARAGGGKSSGYRVVYFFYTAHCPLMLLDIFAKNQKENLSKAERNQLAEVAEMIKQAFKRKR